MNNSYFFAKEQWGRFQVYLVVAASLESARKLLKDENGDPVEIDKVTDHSVEVIPDVIYSGSLNPIGFTQLDLGVPGVYLISGPLHYSDLSAR